VQGIVFAETRIHGLAGAGKHGLVDRHALDGQRAPFADRVPTGREGVVRVLEALVRVRLAVASRASARRTDAERRRSCHGCNNLPRDRIARDFSGNRSPRGALGASSHAARA